MCFLGREPEQKLEGQQQGQEGEWHGTHVELTNMHGISRISLLGNCVRAAANN